MVTSVSATGPVAAGGADQQTDTPSAAPGAGTVVDVPGTDPDPDAAVVAPVLDMVVADRVPVPVPPPELHAASATATTSPYAARTVPPRAAPPRAPADPRGMCSRSDPAPTGSRCADVDS
ncbi:MAG: hypothetical protein U0Q10_07135 [Dermatophilaceae bacterium]